MNFTRPFASRELRKEEFLRRRSRRRWERLCGKRRLQHASASDIASLIYQFGSNVNNRTITNAIAARMAGGAGVSFSLSLSFRRRGPLTTWDARESLVTVARRPVEARDGSILARSSRPSRCIAFRTIVNKFRIWDTHPSIAAFLFGLRWSRPRTSLSFLFFFQRVRPSDSSRLLIRSIVSLTPP